MEGILIADGSTPMPVNMFILPSYEECRITVQRPQDLLALVKLLNNDDTALLQGSPGSWKVRVYGFSREHDPFASCPEFMCRLLEGT